MGPKIDNFIGSSLTLFETSSILFGASGKLGSDCRDVCGGDVDNLFGRVRNSDIEETFF